MSSLDLQRMLKIVNNQLKSFRNRTPSIDGLTFIEDPDNNQKIKFRINCSSDSPWHDKVLTGDINLPPTYPFAPPTVYFTCNLYHPNIYKDGSVCISILKAKPDESGYYKLNEVWTPAIDLEGIIVCIWNILNEPNLESPANLDACIDYRENKELYLIKTREMLTNQ